MKYLVFLALVAGLPTAIISIDASCDYHQDVIPGITYYVYNPGYPNNYEGEHECRWYVRTKETYRLRIDCRLFDIPPSANCATDRLAVSPSGNLNLEDARNYCGTGTFNVSSDSNTMNIVFTSKYNTEGGKFLCTLEAVSTRPASCNCGYKKMSRIVGGMNAGVNEYPMMAGVVNLQNRKVFCGGTIIAKRYVISAAHCFKTESIDDIMLLVGDNDLSTGRETNASKLLQLTEIKVHPKYGRKSGHLANDIAILKTRNDIEFSMNVGPACLPFRYASTTFAGSKVDVLGWGAIGFAEATSAVLQKVTLDVITFKECVRLYRSVTRKSICTFTPGKDACQYDSGGPVLWQSPRSKKLFSVGIISYGHTCADEFPGVNTRVSAYLDWIVSETQDANYCVAE